MDKLKFNSSDTIDPLRAGKYGYIEGIDNPYKVWIFPDFLPDENFKQMIKDAGKIPLEKKYTDMYNFFQSYDIAEQRKHNTSLVNQFVDMMRTDVKKHLETKCGIELDESPFDITVSRYDLNSYLLCHNDHNTDSSEKHCRALAYIYYLTSSPMSKNAGGGLSLFASDKLSQPVTIQQKIYPNPNTLVVFQANPTSWHCVDECLSCIPIRLSINGWFHSSKLPEPSGKSRDVEPCPYQFYKLIDFHERDILRASHIINPLYLKQDFLDKLSDKFKMDEMVKLSSFLQPQIYEFVSRDLLIASKRRLNQTHKGPANRRSYSVLKVNKLSPLTVLVFRFFRSRFFLAFLQRMTGFDLQLECEIDLEEQNDLGTKFLNELKSDYKFPDVNDIEPSTDVWPYSSNSMEKASKTDRHLENTDEGDGSLVVLDNSDIMYTPPKVNKDCNEIDQVEPGNIGESKKRKAENQEQTGKKFVSDSDHLVRIEFRNFEQGSYTILSDDSYEMFEKDTIDMILPFNSNRYNENSCGGHYSYMHRAETTDDGLNKERVIIMPEENSLNLISRKDCMRFFHYMNHFIPFKNKSTFQELHGVYYKRSEGPKIHNLPH